MMGEVVSLRQTSGGAPLRLDVDAALLDIEGTLAPISFVRDVLFAYSRARLSDFVARHRDEAAVAEILTEAARMAGGGDPVAALHRWQDRDEKIPALKKLQGLIWEDGYRTGAFQAPIYADAFAALTRWRTAGIPLYIYSSGSRSAQLLFFAHSVAGDLRDLFSGYFDTETGAKIEPDSYARICSHIDVLPRRLVFFSDNGYELDAARRAGVEIMHVVKDDTRCLPGLRAIADFAEIDLVRSSS